MTTKKTNSSDQKAENDKDNKVDVAPYLSKNNNAKVNNTNNSGSGLKTAGILSLVVIVGTTAYVMFNNKGIDVAETTSTPDNIEQSNSEDQTATSTLKSDSPDLSKDLNTIPVHRPLEETQLVNVEPDITNKIPDTTENINITNTTETKPSDTLTNISMDNRESESDSVFSSFFSYLYQDILDIFGSDNESTDNNDKATASRDTARAINQAVTNSEHTNQLNKATNATQVSSTGKTTQTQPTSITTPSTYPPQAAYPYPPQPPYYSPYGGYNNPAYPPASPYTYRPRWAEPGTQASSAQNSNYNSRNYHDERINYYRQRHQAWLDSHQQRSRAGQTETSPTEASENN